MRAKGMRQRAMGSCPALKCKSHDLIQRLTSDQLSFTGRDRPSVVARGSPLADRFRRDCSRCRRRIELALSTPRSHQTCSKADMPLNDNFRYHNVYTSTPRATRTHAEPLLKARCDAIMEWSLALACLLVGKCNVLFRFKVGCKAIVIR